MIISKKIDTPLYHPGGLLNLDPISRHPVRKLFLVALPFSLFYFIYRSSGLRSERPSWNLLSGEDYDKYIAETSSSCNNPFRHCCPGQCRQEEYQLDEEEILYQLNGDLAGLNDVLTYYAKHVQTDPQSSCNIMFAGDSLSSDHTMGMICHLLNTGYTMKSCSAKGLGKDAYGDDANHKCEKNLCPTAHPLLAHFTLENDMASSCSKVTIAFTFEDGVPDILKSMRSFHDAGGILVFNYGAHCNTKHEGCIEDMISTNILPMVKGENAAAFRQWKITFREMEPQHFDGPGGLYNSKSTSKCVPVRRVDNWRNEEVHNFLSAHNLTQEIPTIPLHDAHIPLWQLHHDGDCTHYCYNPLRFDVAWDGLLKALRVLAS